MEPVSISRNHSIEASSTVVENESEGGEPPDTSGYRYMPSSSSLLSLPETSGMMKLHAQLPLFELPKVSKKVTLSRYFPKGTQYFYGYPVGQDSTFFNTAPTFSEELVSARPLVCAGDDVQVVSYHSPTKKEVRRLLQEEIGIDLLPEQSTLSLPSSISADINGPLRNVMLKDAIGRMTTQKKFIMAQPFLDEALDEKFGLPTQLTVWLNDKRNMTKYIPIAYIPQRYGEFDNGCAFQEGINELPLPCVVKVARSSSGDGVRICHTKQALDAAREEFKEICCNIIVEEYVDVVDNFGMQFGVPSDPRLPVEIIGVSQQLTTPQGEFIGGILDPKKIDCRVDGVNDLLINIVLPYVREMGWYGVGGFDILVDRRQRFFLADPNFRMTGMTAYFCHMRNGIIKRPMVSFSGSFIGTEQDFRRSIVPLVRNGDPKQMVQLIALTRYGTTFRFNGAMLFDDDASMRENATILLRLGVKAKALEQIVG